MTDLVGLENQIIAQIDAANDEQSLEETRVSALGKKGVVSEQMKSLGKMSPEEKKEMFGHIDEGLKKGWVKPISWKTVSLDQAEHAHQEIMVNKGAKGQIVLNIES